MADTSLALQKAIETAIGGIAVPSANTGAASVGVGIFDHPPENAPWPLITLERHDATTETDSYDATEQIHEIELKVWTRYRGTRQALVILGEIYDRLHDVRLALEAGQCLSCRVTRQTTEREPDGTTYTGTLALTVITANEEI